MVTSTCCWCLPSPSPSYSAFPVCLSSLPFQSACLWHRWTNYLDCAAGMHEMQSRSRPAMQLYPGSACLSSLPFQPAFPACLSSLPFPSTFPVCLPSLPFQSAFPVRDKATCSCVASSLTVYWTGVHVFCRTSVLVCKGACSPCGPLH